MKRILAYAGSTTDRGTVWIKCPTPKTKENPEGCSVAGSRGGLQHRMKPVEEVVDEECEVGVEEK